MDVYLPHLVSRKINKLTGLLIDLFTSVCSYTHVGLTRQIIQLDHEEPAPEVIEKGRSRYSPCTACHGVNGEGIAPYPRLAGQRSKYLQQQLIKFKNGARVNTTMRDMSLNLSEDDIKALVMYLATLK